MRMMLTHGCTFLPIPDSTVAVPDLAPVCSTHRLPVPHMLVPVLGCGMLWPRSLDSRQLLLTRPTSAVLLVAGDGRGSPARSWPRYATVAALQLKDATRHAVQAASVMASTSGVQARAD